MPQGFKLYLGRGLTLWSLAFGAMVIWFRLRVACAHSACYLKWNPYSINVEDLCGNCLTKTMTGTSEEMIPSFKTLRISWIPSLAA